ncbi:MAG TPA: ubiquinol-cytochrome c reductase iron-sulfur subunit [Planctomycetaceae bacterium]|nr:ubiquinol-cytochrome c reductase iron-sulfur subunit [Planctomycetaceae bacterium]
MDAKSYKTLGPRRQFLALCTSGLATLMAVLVAIPAMGYFLAPLRSRLGKSQAGQEFQPIGPLDSLSVGQWKLVSFDVVNQDGWEKARSRRSVWVRRNAGANADATVLSPICTHLGCPISWQTDRSSFVCPCHGGVFDANGKNVAGPPPRPMDPIESRVEAGQLLVRWQDFKIGVAERVAVVE